MKLIKTCKRWKYPVSYKPKFLGWTQKDYENNNILYIDPMTAKELDDNKQEEVFMHPNDYIIEEKFDGTRGILHFLSGEPDTPEIKSVFPDWETDPLHYLYVCLLEGTTTYGGKGRVYDYFLAHSSSKDRVKFLQHEYGICGRSGPDNICFGADTHGLTVGSKYFSTEKTFTWSEVCKAIQYLIDEELYFSYKSYTRVFSRRVSKKSGWLTENTDSVPHIRDINCPELNGTIIDGEMFIPNRPFKDVAAIMNCLYDKAIARQEDIGWVVFHAFDVLYYKGECVEDLPLTARKKILHKVMDSLHKELGEDIPIKMVPYFNGNVTLDKADLDKHDLSEEKWGRFNQLSKAYLADKTILPYRAYYEYIVASGGEGVMVKPVEGKYYHKRGWEYSKIKKYLTRDVIVVGFTEPTREYEGKFPTPEEWNYWEDENGFYFDTSVPEELTLVQKNLHNCTPITRFYYNNWVGNIEYGVVITDDEIARLPKNKKFDIRDMKIDGTVYKVIVVGDCAGFDDEMRDYFSNNIDSMIGSVIEVKANEQFKDTGKLRHPRFLRLREDKSASQCTWSEHFG